MKRKKDKGRKNYRSHQHPALYCAIGMKSGAWVMGYPWEMSTVGQTPKQAKVFIRAIQLDALADGQYSQYVDIEVKRDTLCMASPYFYYAEPEDNLKGHVPLFEGNHVMAFNKSDGCAAFAFVVRYGAFIDKSGQEQFGFYGEKTIDPHENCKEVLLSLGDICKDYAFLLTHSDFDPKNS